MLVSFRKLRTRSSARRISDQLAQKISRGRIDRPRNVVVGERHAKAGACGGAARYARKRPGEGNRVVKLVDICPGGRVLVGTNVNAGPMRIGGFESAEAKIGEISARSATVGTVVLKGVPVPKPETFVTEKNESPVLDNRSANGGAKLVLGERHRLVWFPGGDFGFLVEELIGSSKLCSAGIRNPYRAKCWFRTWCSC